MKKKQFDLIKSYLKAGRENRTSRFLSILCFVVVFLQCNNSIAQKFVGATGTGEPYWLIHGENIGVGMGTQPQNVIQLNNAKTIGNQPVFIQFTNSYTGYTLPTQGLKLGIIDTYNAALIQQQNANLSFYTNNLERLTLLNTGYLGLGITNPMSLLDVNGQITIRGGNPGVGKFLVSDANGLAQWQAVVAGTGISLISGTITNTAPDQTISLTGTGATAISGTYPNFTINSTDNNTTYLAGSGLTLTGTTFSNAAPDQTVLLSGTGSTTISGTYPNFTINSTDNNTTYLAGSGLTLTGTTFSNAAPDQTVSLSGTGSTSISGTYPNFTISSTDNNTTYTAGTGLSLIGTVFSNNSPDQTVNINGSTGLSVSGTYPNFTIENTQPDQTVSLTGSGSTMVSGTYPNYTISSTDNNTTYSAGTGISISGTTINNSAPDLTVTLSGSGATTITGSYPNFTISSTDNINDADANPTNELQNLSLTNTQLSISNGNSVDLSSLAGWKLQGNTGTGNFLGTTDNTDFILKTNNNERMRVLAGGFTGIGLSDPKQIMHIHGTTSMASGGGSGGGIPNGGGTQLRSEMDDTDSEEKGTGLTSFNGYLSYIQITNTTTGKASNDGLLIGLTDNTAHIKLQEQGQLRFSTGSQNRMLIFENGNVGIGSLTNNVARLNVTGNTAIGGIFVKNPAGSPYAYCAEMPNENDKAFTVKWNNLNRMAIDGKGWIAIGHDTPQEMLDVRGQYAKIRVGTQNNYVRIGTDGGNMIIDNMQATPAPLYINHYSHNITQFGGNVGICGQDNQVNLYIKQNSNDAKAFVIKNEATGVENFQILGNGHVSARRVRVTQNSWSDFVFKPDYDLLSLSELKAFIKANNHLPGIPTEAEVLEQGIDVGEMNEKLLLKIEELTLYIINLQEEVNELKSEKGR